MKKLSVFVAFVMLISAVLIANPSVRVQAESLVPNAIYTIQNVNSGKMLDVDNGLDSNGTNVQQYEANNSPAQQWQIILLDNGNYKLKSVATSNKMLDVCSASPAAGTNVQIYEDIPSSPGQQFKLALQPDGSYSIQTACSSFTMALDVDSFSMENGANVLQWNNNLTVNQLWYFNRVSPLPEVTPTPTPIPTEQYEPGVPGVIENGIYIITTMGGNALDVVNGGTTDGTRVQLFANNNFNAQKWYVTKLDNGNYTFRSLDTSNMVLDVSAANPSSGAILQLWSSSPDNSAQQYRIEATGDGSYVIRTMCSNYELCVSGTDGGMGANIEQAVYQGQSYQKFIFTKESATQAPGWFSNALDRANSPDPFITYYNGYYYYMKTMGGDVRILRSQHLADVSRGECKIVYYGGDNSPIKYNIWAPEMHLINGRWYIYASGTTAGTDFGTIRMFCLESDNSDPFSNYTYKGQMDISGTLAIDPSVFVDNNTGKAYITYSEFRPEGQCIMIAPMDDPTLIGYPRVQLSAPTYDWERRGTADRPDGFVNEGPIFLQKAEKTFIIYSASGCWSEYYCLGMLECDNDNLLDPASWTKSPVPVFQEGNDVYGVGHNGFFTSPDGTQSWICYHGMDVPWGGEDNRFLYCQPFTWDTNNRPVFGTPAPRGLAIGVPSGETF